MHASELGATFRLTDDEARRANGELRKRAGGTKTCRRYYLGAGVLLTSYALLEPVLWQDGSTVHWPRVLWGASFLMLAALATWGGGSVKAGVEMVLRFSEDGLVCERPRTFAAPWTAIRAAFDDGDFITVGLRETWQHPIPRQIVIPKRALRDAGAALWELSGRSLIGKRMLVCSSFTPASHVAIANTRS